jgi:hypothetical protein
MTAAGQQSLSVELTRADQGRAGNWEFPIGHGEIGILALRLSYWDAMQGSSFRYPNEIKAQKPTSFAVKGDLTVLHTGSE